MKFLIYFLVFLPVFSSHFLQSQGFLSKTEDLTQRKSSYNTKSFFFNKAQFDLAASGFFSLYKTFSKEDLKEAKKKVFGIFDPEDLKIVGSLSIFYNGYYIPASVKMFINSEKDNSLDYEIHPINEELDALKVKLEEDLWYLIQEKKELFDMALAGKTIIVDMINEPNKMKILENEKVKGFKIRFEKKLKKLYKEKKTQFEEIQAIILIIQGASIEGMKDLKEKFANEVKSKVFELKEQLQDMKTLYEILSGKIGDFKALKKPFEARFKADIEKLKIAAEGFKDINLDEYNRLNELMKKKEELLKNLDMKSLKALLLDNVKKLLLEELKRKVKDSRIEMQLIIDKSSNEFKEKQKIFNGLFASLKSAKEKTENLKGLIEEKLKTFEPFIKEMEELAIKGLDYKSLLEKIVEPIKKRFEKEFKEVLRDKKLQFEQLKALKILIEKDSKATLDDLKAMKSYIENYLQEKSQDFNDQMTQISDKTNLEYYRLNSMKNEMEAQINKGVDIEFIKKFIMREFKLEFERYLLEESHKLKQELLIIIDSGSEEYKKLEHKIHDIENKLRNGVFDVKEIKDRVLGQLKLIEPFIKDLEAQIKNGINIEVIKTKILGYLQKMIEGEIREALIEKKAVFDLMIDKTSNEAKKVKTELDKMIEVLKKGVSLDKLKEKILELFNVISPLIQELEFQTKNGFSFQAIKERILKTISEALQSEARKELEKKKIEMLALSEITDEQKKAFNQDIEALKSLIQKGQSITFIEKAIIEKVKQLEPLLITLEKNFKKGIDMTEVMNIIKTSGDQMSKVLLETLVKKAGKFLLFAIFPFAAPMLAAYEFMTDSTTKVLPKIPEIPPIQDPMTMRMKSLNYEGEKTYTDIKFDYVLNEKDPLIRAEVLIQFNAAKLTGAFDVIGNMKDLIGKAWNAMADEARKKLKKVFNVVGEVYEAVGKLAGDVKKAFQDVSEWVNKKAKALLEYPMLKLKELEKDLSQAMSNIKEVADAFLQDSVVGPLKETYGKIGEFGKGILKFGGELMEDAGKMGKDVLNGALELGSKAVDKTKEIVGDIGKGTIAAVGKVADVTKDLAKGTVKIASKAVDAVADVSKDLAKGTVKIASKAVDAVADTAGKVYDFVKFW